MSAIDVLTKNGIATATDLYKAAASVSIPLYIAAAFTQKESNGQNIYGHDSGGVFAVPNTTITVTAANYAEFYQKVVVERRTSNGVGPLQITYPGYFPQAAQQGLHLWLPYDNYRFGLAIIKRNLASAGGDIAKAGTLYNAGSLTHGVTQYGYDVAALAARWKSLLGGYAGVPSTSPASPIPNLPASKAPAFPLPAGYWFGPANGGAHSISGYYGHGADLARWQTQMAHRGWRITADGRYGQQTYSVALGFQREKKLAGGANGLIGPTTWAAAWTAAVTK